MVHLLLFLSSGLFLGWSLGANDAANVFGTAVGAGMVRFRTAAFIASLFVIIGATISGAGAAHTLGSLGAVNALAGSFTVALAAAMTVFWMTRLKLPVSTSQAIIGAIIGWNFFASFMTNTRTLSRIVSTWVICPLLAALFAMLLYLLMREIVLRAKLHILHLDNATRIGLMLAGAFGAYSLGANNIANVMGVFVTANPFKDLTLFGSLTISGTQQLFFLGGLSIAVGIFTYSERVMRTVGKDLLKLSPLSAFVVVLAQSLVLFLFASESLERFLASHGLPTIPLVPVSSSQAVVGAILGIGLIKRGTGIRTKVMGSISLGWISTPIVAGVLSFVMLFFVENVFEMKVYHEMHLRLDTAVIEELQAEGLYSERFEEYEGREFRNPEMMKRTLKEGTGFTSAQLAKVIGYCKYGEYQVTAEGMASLKEASWLTKEQVDAVGMLEGRKYEHPWQLVKDLELLSPSWQLREESVLNKEWNRTIERKRDHLLQVFDKTLVENS